MYTYHMLLYFKDPVEVGGLVPFLITGTSQSGDILGFITGMPVDGVCSIPKNTQLLSKYSVEQISPGTYIA